MRLAKCHAGGKARRKLTEIERVEEEAAGNIGAAQRDSDLGLSGKPESFLAKGLASGSSSLAEIAPVGVGRPVVQLLWSCRCRTWAENGGMDRNFGRGCEDAVCEGADVDWEEGGSPIYLLEQCPEVLAVEHRVIVLGQATEACGLGVSDG